MPKTHTWSVCWVIQPQAETCPGGSLDPGASQWEVVPAARAVWRALDSSPRPGKCLSADSRTRGPSRNARVRVEGGGEKSGETWLRQILCCGWHHRWNLGPFGYQFIEKRVIFCNTQATYCMSISCSILLNQTQAIVPTPGLWVARFFFSWKRNSM